MIYVGVTAENGGAFAMAYGMNGDIDIESFDAGAFIQALSSEAPMEVRCVIEMPEEGIIERAVKKPNAAVVASTFCQARGIPFMYVKTGSLRRAYDMNPERSMTEECRIRYPEHELRGMPQEQEAAASALLLARYARRYL